MRALPLVTLPCHNSTRRDNGYILDLSLESFSKNICKNGNYMMSTFKTFKKGYFSFASGLLCQSYTGSWSWILVPGCPEPDTNSPNVTVNITRDMTPTRSRHQDTHLIFKPRKTNHHNDILPSRTHPQTNWTTHWISFLNRMNIFLITLHMLTS